MIIVQVGRSIEGNPDVGDSTALVVGLGDYFQPVRPTGHANAGAGRDPPVLSTGPRLCLTIIHNNESMSIVNIFIYP